MIRGWTVQAPVTVGLSSYLESVPVLHGKDARMKEQIPATITDRAKSALGFGLASWVVAALICPALHIDYSNTRQLFVLGSGAGIGAVLSYIFREGDRFATHK